MKKILSLSIIALLFLAGCLKKQNNSDPKCTYKESTTKAPQAEQDALQDSLTAYGLHATLDTSGFYYTITDPGSGPAVADLCSLIAIYYKAGFFNGKSFDSSLVQPAVFQLGQLIAGWQKGIPLLKKGGKITLYIPPSLGYGAEVKKDRDGNILIPANSYMVFDITLADLQE